MKPLLENHIISSGRVFIVEDNGAERRLLKEELAPSSLDNLHFTPLFWGESGQRTQPYDADVIAQHILDHQEDYDAILLDFALNLQEEEKLVTQQDLTPADIRGLADRDCPGAIRILRRIIGKNRIPVATWTRLDFRGWSEYAQTDLQVDWPIPKVADQYRELRRYLSELCSIRAILEKVNRIVVGDSSKMRGAQTGYWKGAAVFNRRCSYSGSNWIREGGGRSGHCLRASARGKVF